jgi:hypothetical protein
VKPVSTKSTPFKETDTGNIVLISSFGVETQTILTVETNCALMILSPILQWGTTPYSGL